jgi:alcohol dehydrogenase
MAHDDASTQHRAWTIPSGVRFGDLERLVLLQQPFPDPPKEKTTPTIRVATRAVGLNFADVFTILGYYTAANLVRTKTNQAFVPGLEFAGVVLEDDGGDGFSKGDRVYGFKRFGAYSDLVHVAPTQLRKLPSNWTFEQGAAFLVNALTAWYGLVTVAGMSDCNHTEYYNNNDNPFVVVVHSAAGGVGLWACEIAARLGALVVGIVGDESKTTTFYERIRPLCPFAQCLVRRNDAREFAKGLASAICRARSQATGLEAPDWKDANDLVQAGWGANVLMESYGGQYFQPCMDLMNAGGSIATYGSTTYNGSGSGTRLPFVSLILKYLQRPMIDPGELTGRNLRVGGFNLIFLTENTKELSKALEDCIACLSGTDNRSANALESVTPPVVGNVFNFDNGAIDALTALRSGKTVGKVVLSNKNNPLLTNTLHGDSRMES